MPLNIELTRSTLVPISQVEERLKTKGATFGGMEGLVWLTMLGDNIQTTREDGITRLRSRMGQDDEFVNILNDTLIELGVDTIKGWRS